jgi:hypothetical protein
MMNGDVVRARALFRELNNGIFALSNPSINYYIERLNEKISDGK